MNKFLKFFKAHKKLARLCVAALLNAVIFSVMAIFYKFVFFINDDKTIQEALSGKLTGEPSSYGVFVAQIICLPLKWLYGLAPTFPFYATFLFLVIFTCCIFICYYILNFEDKKSAICSTVFYVCMFVALFFFHAINIQFTTAAMFPVLLAFVMMAREPKLRVYHYFLLAFLFLLSYGIRTSVFLLALIFLSVFLILRIIKDKHLWVSSLLVLLCAVLAIGITAGAEKLATGKDTEYQNYVEFNDVRSDLCDHYGVPEYDEAKELYDELGISREAVELFGQHYVYDLEECTTENLQKILEWQKAHYKQDYAKVFKVVFVGNFFYNNLSEFLFLCLLFAMVIILSKHRKKASIVAGTMFILLIGLSVAICIVMKFPARVCSCVLNFTSFTFLGTFLCEEYQPLSKGRKWFFATAGLLVLGVLAFSFMFGTITNLHISGHNEEKYELEQIIKGDKENLYFLDNTCTTYYSSFAFEKNDRTERVFYPTWQAKSPYQQSLIESLGFESLNDMFENATNLKIVVRGEKEIEPLAAYIKNKYGRDLIFDSQFKDLYFYVPG